MANDTNGGTVRQQNTTNRSRASHGRSLGRLRSSECRPFLRLAVAFGLLVATAGSGTEDSQIQTIRDSRGVEMVYVPEVTFMMGSEDAGPDAQPIHKVTVSPFFLDITEVTYRQFHDFLVENPKWRKDRADRDLVDNGYLFDWNGLQYPKGLGEHPVVWISWDAAAAYAEWRGARLPTEAEWEAAARGPDGRPWPWGWNEPDSGGVRFCNYGGNGHDGGSVPVGIYPDGASPFGALDMAGNVWEWVADWHDPEYYAESPRLNPVGPLVGTFRVLRGGSWSVPVAWTRSMIRMRAYPARCSDQVGFRCARDAPE